jgi:hypothetical protein
MRFTYPTRKVVLNVTVTILDIIHRPVVYLKYDVSEIEFCPRLKVEPSQLCQIDRSSLCVRFHLKKGTEFSLRNAVF